jgi:hypothetical protein
MSAGDPSYDALTEMGQCAYRLGMAFGRQAEQVEEFGRKVELFELFERCFFGVRVAEALKLRLRREGGAVGRVEREAEREDHSIRAERESSDAERAVEPEPDRECDRERETERSSLPLLLRTLKGVADAAAALPGPEPAELPVLRELLGQMAPDPAPAPAPAARPRQRPPNLRARLAGSAAATVTAAPLRSPGAPQVRRATGPPRR